MNEKLKRRIMTKKTKQRVATLIIIKSIPRNFVLFSLTLDVSENSDVATQRQPQPKMTRYSKLRKRSSKYSTVFTANSTKTSAPARRRRILNAGASSSLSCSFFRPFVDQPAEFPPRIHQLQSSPTKISELELSPNQLEKILVFDSFAHQRHFDQVSSLRNSSSPSSSSSSTTRNNNESKTSSGGSAHHFQGNQSDSETKSTFIEAVERILLAIESTKIDSRKRCQSLVLVNGVFSGSDDTQRRLAKSLQGLLAHPASQNSQAQLQNKQRFILSPLIVSSNSRTRTSNIFSFGNEVVELFEGLAWSVPRYYGYPIHYAPAGDEASYCNAPSGVLAYFTPASFQVIENIVENQFLSHRYRVGREWIEKARGNYAIGMPQNNNKNSNNNNDESSDLQQQRQRQQQSEEGYKQRNKNGIADVDVEVVVAGAVGADAHHHHHHPWRRDSAVVETHLLVCDAALAELAATAAKSYNTFAVAVRAAVAPLVFHEEPSNTLSTRYMLAVAHAATGLGSIHYNNDANNNNNNNQYQQQQQPFVGDSFPVDQPQKLAALPAVWAIRALPFVTSIAGDVWFRYVGQQFLPNTTVFWDPYCSCTGINIEAINFLVPLEKYVRTRAVAAPDCWCPGFPAADQFALKRMQAGKLLSKGSTSKFHIWISHKPVDAFPTSFPYDGSIKYDKSNLAGFVTIGNSAESGDSEQRKSRPDLVIGRTMTESDRISPDWVRRLNDEHGSGRIDELWVPSHFLLDAFRKSGVRSNLPIVVIPEAIDVNFYDPQFTTVHPQIHRQVIGCPGDPATCFVFLSNFKWEHRKGWDILLRAYFTTFTATDNVVLVLKTYLYMEPGGDGRNPEKIRNKIFTWAQRELRDIRRLKHLPKIWIIPEEIPAFHMPKLYRGADCFVLPTRGEGWGLPLHEAMAMGLVTIGTGWGGNVDFMPRSGDGSTHFLINVSGFEVINNNNGEYRRDATDAEIRDPNRKDVLLIARPSVEHLSELMRRAAFNMTTEERRRMGNAARWHVANKFSRASVTEIVLKRLVQLYQANHGV